jgi:hypothetical protein
LCPLTKNQIFFWKPKLSPAKCGADFPIRENPRKSVAGFHSNKKPGWLARLLIASTRDAVTSLSAHRKIAIQHPEKTMEQTCLR